MKARTASASTPLPANTKTIKAGVIDPKKVARIALQNVAFRGFLLLAHRMPLLKSSGT